MQGSGRVRVSRDYGASETNTEVSMQKDRREDMITVRDARVGRRGDYNPARVSFSFVN